ncbi:elongation factor G-like protein EF-G2 [Geodermatophilus sp. YIM 151500]|uniref:elongation factor G-like protein EF-G2 n=1 Tax=Geodermatophilus sp. YIM 151500 TaxID=2984531 RepID=UPI0021E37179|nr:elongation factor G-like protein EF-G2 [Geodermatophilus sp. YIM 151500]MCV2489061.1 elongation factor G-like protein EF-G2 [Geodermatophilus sp. YIM 151500]
MAKDTAAAPAPRPADKVRNVALVGHAGAGKTTLAEALLVAAGALPRAGRVEDGTTCLDTEEVEVRQQRSVSLGVATLEHDGHRITLLDTPGSPDFVGELRAGLRAADAALFVVSAVNGVDAATVQLWQECAAVGMPRAVVITQLDRARADVDDAVRLCQMMLGEGVHPLHLVERGADGAVTGLVSLLQPHPEAATAAADADRLRAELIEGIIGESEDETLMERYLAGDELAVADLVADLETAVARGHFHPVLCVAPLTGVGVPELLDLLVSAFPSPLEHGCPRDTRPDGSPAPPLACDPDGPLVAEVVKTTTDPYVGRVSLVRVFSGTLRPDVPVHVSGHGLADRGHPDHDVDERIGAVSSPLGTALRPVAACPAGDICAVARLSSAETGDTLSSPDDPRLVPPWDLPTPQLPVAVEAASRSDEDRLATALGRLVAEDPTVRLERRPDTGQLLLWCVGEAHAEVLLDRLRTRHGVTVQTVPVRVPMVETLAGAATATGRHVKQSGGHGQYAIVVVEAEPGPPGSGIVFEQRIVGGTVPSQYHGSVEKGVRAQAERGISGDRPIVDVHVTLVDGKAHSVDSSDAAFQAAGALALRELAAAAGTRVLEPWCEIEVVVPAEYVGAVMSDLSARRARVTGSEADPDRDRTRVRAEVPEVELLTYPGVLRSVTHGTGSFDRRPLGYEPAPPSVTAVPA